MNDDFDNSRDDKAMLTALTGPDPVTEAALAERARQTEHARQVQEYNGDQLYGELDGALKTLTRAYRLCHQIDDLFEREAIMLPPAQAKRLREKAAEILDYANTISRLI